MATYNDFTKDRIKLLQASKAFAIGYPEDPCKQFRELRNVWRSLQHGVGFDLGKFFAANQFEGFAAEFLISKIRGILCYPKNFLLFNQKWGRNKARNFPNITRW